MITLSHCAQQKIAVFGLGKAGEATIAALLAGGAQVFAWDDKPADIQAYIMHYDQWPWDDIASLVLSPGVPLTHPKPHAVVEKARQHGVEIIGDIELLYRQCPEATYVGITGTNGKSTTTTLIGHILKSAGLKVEVGGNLGTAALSLAPLGKDGVYVLELSSYQLDLVKTTRFNIAAFLNIAPDHLDRHGSMEGYVAAKMHIFDRQTRDDTAVIAVDDEYTKEVASCQLLVASKVKVVKASAQRELEDGIYAKDGVISDHSGNQQLVTGNLSSIETLTGRHNWQNAVVAYGVAKACGVASDTIYAAMSTFAGLRHRLQLVATINGVRFVNDSKATNADAASHALAPYQSIYWIAGGKAKEGGIVPLAPYFTHIRHAFLIGAAEADFAKTLEGKVAYTRCGTLEMAFKKASEHAFADKVSGAVVLLSPACASFDQWKSFEHRGDAFCDLVEGLYAA
jgi:UDP-N-acetylmuramoylalanine--D-glutamate ligase